MKLTPEKSNILRDTIGQIINDRLDCFVENLNDNEFREEVTDQLSEDFTDEEIEELVELWDNNDEDEGIDNNVWMGFIDEILNGIMKRIEK